MEKQPVVIVIDDDDSVRTAINRLLKSVGLDTRSYASAQEFLDSKPPDAPTCIVSDVRLPGLSGLDLQKELARGQADFPIILLTGHGDIPMAVQAMKAGAVEFLTKPFRDQDLLDAVHAGLERDRSRRKDGATIAHIKKRFDLLTPREKDVMKLVVTGLPNKQIGARMGLSEVTVKVHRSRVMQKMGVKTLADLIQIANQIGLPPARPAA